MSLSEIITERIKSSGPISFCDFMEMALYFPELGYYTSAGDKIGGNGDYYTTPAYTSIFGTLAGKQLEEMWTNLGRKNFTVVEYGAGTGLLCRDILNYAKTNDDFYNKLNYHIIEKSAPMRQKQEMLLTEKVEWHASIKELPQINGCILSNELVDNFPVHQVVMEQELMEVHVGFKNGFKELLQPASASIKTYFEQLKVALPKGYRTEVNLQATEWITEIANAIEEGYLMTIDYGYLSSELYNDSRKTGTIVCYHKHATNYEPYCRVGEQDITAHVNFSALHNWGNRNGLTTCGYTNQANFMHALGIASYLRAQEQIKNTSNTQNPAMFIHTLMSDMGRKFKVLIQEKTAQRSRLSGMFFAQQYL